MTPSSAVRAILEKHPLVKYQQLMPMEFQGFDLDCPLSANAGTAKMKVLFSMPQEPRPQIDETSRKKICVFVVRTIGAQGRLLVTNSWTTISLPGKSSYPVGGDCKEEPVAASVFWNPSLLETFLQTQPACQQIHRQQHLRVCFHRTCRAVWLR